jgi:hypothetical protein
VKDDDRLTLAAQRPIGEVHVDTVTDPPMPGNTRADPAGPASFAGAPGDDAIDFFQSLYVYT